MSMLAERRRKQKYTLNPNGKAWVQDSNKFGQKLLEKMGWQHGKGLGANEDGMTEHIKVSHKMDSKGMGYKETDGQWTQHESNFTALLTALSGDKIVNEPEVPLKSLEKKSQNSRARVHYKKFTRGKDLTRYSEKDLANIFGKKSLKSEPKKDSFEETHNADTDSKESDFYFSGGSMTDYFKKKLPNFGKINDSYTIGNDGVLKKARDSESESEMKPSFGFGFKTSQQNMPLRMKAEENHQKEFCLSANKNKVDKKQKKNEDLGQSNPAFDPLASLVMKLERHNLAPIEESVSDYMNENIDTSLCKNEENSGNSEEGNKTLNEEHEKSREKRKYVADKCVEKIEQIKSKKKKKKNHSNSYQKMELQEQTIVEKETSGNSSVGNSDVLPSNNAKQSKKKKKNKEKMIYNNSSFQFQNSLEESLVIDKNPYEVNMKNQKKKKKLLHVNTQNNEDKKNRKSKMKKSEQVPMEVENAGFCDIEDIPEPNIIEENPYEVKVKEKKKQSKKLAIENPNFDDTENNVPSHFNIEENPHEVKVKDKKKKTKKLAIENPNFDSTEDSSPSNFISEENPYEVKIKEKKKSIKKLAIKNLNFDNTKDSSPSRSIWEENPYEVKIKESKKTRKKLAIENPNFDNIEDNLPSSSISEENPYEIKIKSKKKQSKNLAVENQNFDDTENSLPSHSIIEENPYEVKPKKVKKNKNKTAALENPCFNDSMNSSSSTTIYNPYEVKPKKRKESKRIAVSVRNENTTQSTNLVEENTNAVQNSEPNNDSALSENCDLMLNIVSTPIIEPVRTPKIGSVTKINSLTRRKSVRFSDVTQELIIPNNDDLREMYDEGGTKQMDSISKTLDNYQAEMENDINEEKIKTVSLEDIMIGEVGNPHGENEKLSEGTKLKFKYARLHAKTPFYQLNQQGAKKAYKHLIKGDIMVKFQNTNLHEINGYAVNNKTVA